MDKLSKPGKAEWITLRFIIAAILFLATLFIFVSIADEIVLENNSKFDQIISKKILSFESPAITGIMEVFTFFGSHTFLFPAYIILIVFYFFQKKTRLALDIIMVGLSSTGILFLFKSIFQRTRPLDPLIKDVTGFSFPSGHSFSSFTFFGMMIYIIWQTKIRKGWKILFSVLLFLFASVIAFSRVYLRVHYPSDVIAGFCLSIVWLILSLWILHKIDLLKFFTLKAK